MANFLWSVFCRCSFGSAYRAASKQMPNASIVPTDCAVASADSPGLAALELQKCGKEQPPISPRDDGLISFLTDAHLPLLGSPVRRGEVYALPSRAAHLADQGQLEPVTLVLHLNGFAVERSGSLPDVSVSWTPFGLVQACRFHSAEVDTGIPWLRLFKITVFHHGKTHFFATYGAEADLERARWVADIARAMRVLTQSLFPMFELSTQPLLRANWTRERLLAGYMLLCDNQDISLVYCELHSHWDAAAAFVMYEDHHCAAKVLCIDVSVATCINERVGVDCSCFSIDGYHFSVRTSSEKGVWLRAINNVKVKLRYGAANPTTSQLDAYRAAIRECARGLKLDTPKAKKHFELLPRRRPTTGYAESPSHGSADADSTEEGSCQKVTSSLVTVKSNASREVVAVGPSLTSLALSSTQDAVPSESSRAPVGAPPGTDYPSKPRSWTPRSTWSNISRSPRPDGANGDVPSEVGPGRAPSETSSTTARSGLVGGMASVATLSEMYSGAAASGTTPCDSLVQGTTKDPSNSRFSL